MTSPFDGETYDERLDGDRLRRQLDAVQLFMADGEWRTKEQIGTSLGIPAESAGARLRDLRKDRFGGHIVDRRRVNGRRGLFEYRLVWGQRRARAA